MVVAADSTAAALLFMMPKPSQPAGCTATAPPTKRCERMAPLLMREELETRGVESYFPVCLSVRLLLSVPIVDL